MSYVKCFDSLLDVGYFTYRIKSVWLTKCQFTLWVLANTKHPELLVAIIDTLHRFATIWSCMNIKRDIVLALDSAHQASKSRGIQSRGLLSLLVEFDRDKSYLSPASRERIDSDLCHFTLVRAPYPSS